MIELSHCAYAALAGSWAHGTQGAESDIDIRGVFILRLEQRLALRDVVDFYEGPVPDSLWQAIAPTIATRTGAHPPSKIECAFFDIGKFLALCSTANPNALELLFADESDILYCDARGRRIREARALFLTRKLEHTFCGYATAQLRKIESHRSWLLCPPIRKPLREDFGLPEGPSLSRDEQNRLEQAIAERMRSYGIDDLEMPGDLRIAIRDRLEHLLRDLESASTGAPLRTAAEAALAISPATSSVLQAERKYRAALRHWDAYQEWKKHRNPARAELEARFGYDTKHAAHLIRLLRMAQEALRDGKLSIKRHDAADLRAIRGGIWSYDALLAQAKALEAAIRTDAARSALPLDVDAGAVDDLYFALATDSR